MKFDRSWSCVAARRQDEPGGAGQFHQGNAAGRRYHCQAYRVRLAAIRRSVRYVDLQQ